MNPKRAVHMVVPEGIEDPARPSGGNTYDRQLCDHLAADGWSVCVRGVAGDWPWAGEPARRARSAAAAAATVRHGLSAAHTSPRTREANGTTTQNPTKTMVGARFASANDEPVNPAQRVRA